MSMGLTIAICGAFFLGGIVGSCCSFFYWVMVLKDPTSRKVMLKKLCEMDPFIYSAECDHCQMQRELDSVEDELFVRVPKD